MITSASTWEETQSEQFRKRKRLSYRLAILWKCDLNVSQMVRCLMVKPVKPSSSS